MDNYYNPQTQSQFGGSMDASLIASQFEDVNAPSQNQNFHRVPFDVKNYLNARLAQGESSKTVRIRLLPFSQIEQTPFHKMKVHRVKVNKAVTAGGWKTFVCPKNENPANPCPFCEVSMTAKEAKNNATTEALKEQYNSISFSNMAKDSWFVRCIDRDHEDEGVKFWMFSHAGKKKDGVYDKIMALFNARKVEGINIFDLNNGYDLLLTISKDSQNNTVYHVTDAKNPSPLTADYNLGMSWINDSKTVADLYPVKSYDYMAIIVDGGVPFFDKTQNKFVDSSKFAQAKQEEQAKQVAENYTTPTYDLSRMNNGVVTQQGGQPQPFPTPQTTAGFGNAQYAATQPQAEQVRQPQYFQPTYGNTVPQAQNAPQSKQFMNQPQIIQQPQMRQDSQYMAQPIPQTFGTQNSIQENDGLPF